VNKIALENEPAGYVNEMGDLMPPGVYESLKEVDEAMGNDSYKRYKPVYRAVELTPSRTAP
jgi:hypothetical protein